MPKAAKGFSFKHTSHISRLNLVVFVAVFAAIGTYILIHSFAAPNPNLPGDLNGDNTVNGSDLAVLLSDFGTTNTAADINSDGTVNIIDLSILVSHYGQTYSGGGGGIALPTAPQSYTLPSGATVVSTSAQLTSALSSGVANIVLADGTYANSTYFSDASSNIYAQHLGKAVLNAGLVVGGNSGAGGDTVQGLAFNLTNNSLGFQGAELNIWGPAGANTKVYDCTFEGNYDMDFGIVNLKISGFVAQRLALSHFHADAMEIYDNNHVPYGSSTPHINTITDIAIDGVHAATPGSSNGTAEAGLWVGNPVDNPVSRISVKNVYWSS